MPVPWLRIARTVIGLSDVARTVKRAASGTSDDLATTTTGPLEARLAGVVVAALKEAFDRDHVRLELEREQIEAERQRAERALRLELARQAGDREVGRLRFLAGVAAVSWLGTFFSAAALMNSGTGARVALGVGWALLLGALGACFTAQSAVADNLMRAGDRTAADFASSGPAGAAAPWLIVLGLAVIGFGILFA